MPSCKNCQKEFTITDADRAFYHKMDVPEPTWCPQCRQIRRLMWRNEKSLYPDTCDLCGKNIISNLNPNRGYTVYCYDCWWSDKWNPLDYSFEFDWTKPFFPQFSELIKKIPQNAIFASRSVNCEYSNIIADCKNCYLSSGIRESEDVMYSRWIQSCRDSIDCSYIWNTELCYQAIQCFDCYGCFYIQNADNCHDCCLCFDCNGCSNCFGCVGLRNVNNFIFNQPATEEEYKNKLKEFLSGRDKFNKYQNEFEILKKTKPHAHCRAKKVINCDGDYLLNSKNCHDCYVIDGEEDCRFNDYANRSKDNYDATAFTDVENSYEVHSAFKNYSLIGTSICWYSNFVYYSYCCFNTQNCFGCAGFKKGKNSFFNKQYSEEEYLKIKEKIIAHMKKTGEWGEFLPPSICPFGFNETAAYYHYPFTRDQVLTYGWKWEDNLSGTFGQETIKQILENIDEVSENILKEILACQKCKKNYKILTQELKFYKKLGIPIPLMCPSCRFEARERKVNPRQLLARECMCDQPGHKHQDKCQNKFKTTYAPDRPEKVYCEECYQKEIY